MKISKLHYLRTPTGTQVSPFNEISILFWEGIIKKISYERRAYESVDEKSHLKLCPEKRQKKKKTIWSIKG